MSMRALLLKKYGTPTEALSLEEIPKPIIDEESDEMLVRVVAASLAPAEVRIIGGELKNWTIFPMPPLPVPWGLELSGVVDKVGNKVQRFKPGDEVFGIISFKNFGKTGAMADYVIVNDYNVGHKPKNISFEEAAAIGATALTALQALKQHNGARDVALIPGGMGGVGTFAVQLAKNYFGFGKVIITVSTAKVPLIKEAIPYVDQVIDYKTQDLTKEIPPKSVDFVLDQFGNVHPWLRYLNTSPSRPKPSIIGITTIPNSSRLEAGWQITLPWYLKIVLNLADAYLRWWIPGNVHYDSLVAVGNAEDFEELASIAGPGLMKSIVTKVFPFEEAAQAYEAVKGGGTGKVVVRVSQA